MSLSCGLIGLPNVGKSTLFNTLTKSHVPALNFPFCTIKPNIGIVPVCDERVKILSNIVQSNKKTYGYIKFIDIAGLVKGASKGEGLGNQFLNNIRNVDVVIHVVRCFQNLEIIHINNKIDPILDISIINQELISSDLSICTNLLKNLNKKNIPKDQDIDYIRELLKKCEIYLSNKNLLRISNFSIKEKDILSFFNFLTLKPVIYILNLDKTRASRNLYKQIKIFLNKEKESIIPIFMKNSKRVSSKDINRTNNNVKNYYLSQSDYLQIINQCFNLLNLCTFFTVGTKEVRAWLFLKNSNAIQVANLIHSDFSKGFIRVKVISYHDFLVYKDEKDLRALGKLRIEGRNYIIQDGDILNFLFNV
ncbi:redox-regulated ATPase YchF [Buchnera aphidicola (Mollitrichosiphum nigrofasciatum)]|uniref:redox-regulated ATPase YchF n=1 Tax=Buchnera aphidicola TaxID=9 RepID=UPI0031B7FE5A